MTTTRIVVLAPVDTMQCPPKQVNYRIRQCWIRDSSRALSKDLRGLHGHIKAGFEGPGRPSKVNQRTILMIPKSNTRIHIFYFFQGRLKAQGRNK